MATLTQIADAFDSADVRKKIVGAVIELGTTIRNESATTPKRAARLKWARKAMLNPRQMAERMTGGVLVDAGVNAEIPSVTDPAIQAAVEALVLKFANANLPEATDAT